MRTSLIYYLVYTLVNICTCETERYCEANSKDETDCTSSENASKSRYILYDINAPEGFNLRRDVYMRMAIFAHLLSKSSNKDLNSFKLVLPPWMDLYHWRNYRDRERFEWGRFFDIVSLQKFAPVIEMSQYFNEVRNMYSNKVEIEQIYVLQHFKGMFESGVFEEKMEVVDCDREIQLDFFHYNNVTFKDVKCLSFHGHSMQLKEILLNSKARSLLFDHAEIVLHDRYGDKKFWQARRSMQFNKNLERIGSTFRKENLNSTDERDGITKIQDWTKDKPKSVPKGGPYLCIHLRRRDFLWGRPDEVPSIEGAAKQIKKLLAKLNLMNIFVATDAPENEFADLKTKLGSSINVFKYVPISEEERKLRDGELAIIDQIVCSHAQYFIGTFESTFSFRIQEEREILGFNSDTTFNRLCGDKADKDCSRPSLWKIVY